MTTLNYLENLITTRNVIRIVCGYYKVKVSQLHKGTNRNKLNCESAKHAIRYYLFHLKRESKSDIAKIFKIKTNHTTIINSIKVWQGRLDIEDTETIKLDRKILKSLKNEKYEHIN